MESLNAAKRIATSGADGKPAPAGAGRTRLGQLAQALRIARRVAPDSTAHQPQLAPKPTPTGHFVAVAPLQRSASTDVLKGEGNIDIRSTREAVFGQMVDSLAGGKPMTPAERKTLMGKLHAEAMYMQTKVNGQNVPSETEIYHFLTIGRDEISAIKAGNGRPHPELKHVVGVVWYLNMLHAAKETVANPTETTSLFGLKSGSITTHDGIDAGLFRYFSSFRNGDLDNGSPTPWPRAQSHFGDSRVPGSSQGFELSKGLLPAGKQNILFAQLRDGYFFLKTETGGWPPTNPKVIATSIRTARHDLGLEPLPETVVSKKASELSKQYKAIKKGHVAGYVHLYFGGKGDKQADDVQRRRENFLPSEVKTKVDDLNKLANEARAFLKAQGKLGKDPRYQSRPEFDSKKQALSDVILDVSFLIKDFSRFDPDRHDRSEIEAARLAAVRKFRGEAPTETTDKPKTFSNDFRRFAYRLQSAVEDLVELVPDADLEYVRGNEVRLSLDYLSPEQ